MVDEFQYLGWKSCFDSQGRNDFISGLQIEAVCCPENLIPSPKAIVVHSSKVLVPKYQSTSSIFGVDVISILKREEKYFIDTFCELTQYELSRILLKYYL
jgi:hypothetical protein